MYKVIFYYIDTYLETDFSSCSSPCKIYKDYLVDITTDEDSWKPLLF